MVRNTVSETVRQIISRMFINEVLSKYSFVGQKKKLSFSILNSCTVIFGKKNKIFYFLMYILKTTYIHLNYQKYVKYE